MAREQLYTTMDEQDIYSIKEINAVMEEAQGRADKIEYIGTHHGFRTVAEDIRDFARDIWESKQAIEEIVIDLVKKLSDYEAHASNEQLAELTQEAFINERQEGILIIDAINILTGHSHALFVLIEQSAAWMRHLQMEANAAVRENENITFSEDAVEGTLDQHISDIGAGIFEIELGTEEGNKMSDSCDCAEHNFY